VSYDRGDWRLHRFIEIAFDNAARVFACLGRAQKEDASGQQFALVGPHFIKL